VDFVLRKTVVVALLGRFVEMKEEIFCACNRSKHPEKKTCKSTLTVSNVKIDGILQ